MSTFYHSSQSGGGPPGPPGAKGDQGDRGPGVLNWRGDWSVTEAYEPNDAVALDGSAYICVEAHTGSQPPSARWNLFASRGSQGVQGEKGDEGDQGEKGDRGDRGPQGVPGEQGRQGVPGARGYPGEKGDEGDKGDPGIRWRGAWDSLTQYVPGDAVQHDGSCHISVAESIGSEPPSANWGLMVAKGVPGEPGAQGNDGTPGLNWKGEWNDITTYDRNDVVFFNGSSYVAVAENTNDAPPSDNWNMLAQKGSGGGGGGSINWRGAWSAGAYYEIDDAVSRNGSSYLCIQAHSNHEPPNSTYWGVLAQKGDTGEQGLPGLEGDKGDTGEQGAVGINWRGTWSSSTPYALRDGVTYNGTSYVCTQANTNQQPPNASYWDVLAAKGDPGGAGAGPVSLTNADSVALNGCQVVFSFGSGSCKRAKADALGTATVIGLAAVGDNPPGSLMGVVVDGPVTASTSAWDAVTGLSGGLTAGAVYYLSSVTAGWLTTSVPSTLGQFIVRIGVALSSTTMLIQIQPPIQL